MSSVRRSGFRGWSRQTYRISRASVVTSHIACILFLLFPQAIAAAAAFATPKLSLSASTEPVVKSFSGRQAAIAPRSRKRGLVDIPSTASYTTQDTQTLTPERSDLTWFYSYSAAPANIYTPPGLQFVPMLWGSHDDGFRDFILSQVNSGVKIPHVLAFNEPDLCYGGGSCISPERAAELWKIHLEPLRRHEINVSTPAVTGSGAGLLWLQNFFAACDGRCHPDFIALHWYGDFAGLAGWIGLMNGTFGHNITGGLWVTEFAYPFVSLEDAQLFYNESTRYMDDLAEVKRYSYFGAFRSTDSNIGPNAAMLDAAGGLTDIGAYYIGVPPTGNLPQSEKGPPSSSPVHSINTVILLCIVFALFFLFY